MLNSDSVNTHFLTLLSMEPWWRRNSLGERLIALMKAARVSNTELAAAIGVHTNTVSYWRSGKQIPEESAIEDMVGLFRERGIEATAAQLRYGGAPKRVAEAAPAKEQSAGQAIPMSVQATIEKASAAEIDSLMSETQIRGHRYKQRRMNGADDGELRRLMRDVEAAARNYIEAQYGSDRPIDEMVAVLVASCTAGSGLLAETSKISPQNARTAGTRKP